MRSIHALLQLLDADWQSNRFFVCVPPRCRGKPSPVQGEHPRLTSNPAILTVTPLTTKPTTVVWSEDFEGHIQDTIIAGDGLCNEKVVRDIILHGADRIQELIDWGMEFDEDSTGNFDLGREGGHHTRRVLHTGDLTGKSLLAKWTEV